MEPESSSIAGGLGGFSDELGGLFLGEIGSGLSDSAEGGVSGAGQRNGSRPRRPKIIVATGAGVLEMFEGRRAFRIEFAIEHVPGSDRSLVIASPAVVLDGHAIETDPPVGVALPEVICWIGPDGARHTGDRVVASGPAAGPWTIYVSVPRDAAVSVDLEAMSGGRR
jgi:hypothetical protein